MSLLELLIAAKKDPVWSNEGPRLVMDLFGVSFCARIAVFIARSPKGDLGHQGHLGDLLPKIGLLKVTFLFKSLLSERKDDGDVLHTIFATQKA